MAAANFDHIPERRENWAEAEFEGEVSLLGERHRASVRLRHPDATDADLGLTIIPDIDFAEAPMMRS